MVNRAQLATLARGDQRLLSDLEGLFRAFENYDPEALAALVAAISSALSGVVAQAAAQARPIPQSIPWHKPPAPMHRAPSVDYVDLANAPHITAPRRVQWNEDDGTLDVGLLNGVVLQSGQELHYYAKNTSGGAIANGSGVMASGTVGASGKLTIAPAVADGSVEPRYFIGVATQDIANGAFGYVTAFGLVRGFNTSAWSDGDLLYFDPTTPGGLVSAAPSAPLPREPVAIVIHSGSGGSGSIFVRMSAGPSIGDLRDVHAPAPSDGDLLRWSGANDRWELYSGASGTFTTADSKTVTVSKGIITGIV